MGNRAIIINKKDMLAGEKVNPHQIGVYLHWNGGFDSVSAFLKYCSLKGYRAPSSDCYGWARLCQVIGNFFGGGLSLGINTLKHFPSGEHCDNGIYIIDGWEIVGRLYNGIEQRGYYVLEDMLQSIDKSMPEGEQLGEDYWNADDVPIEDIKVGDKIVVPKNGEDDFSRHGVFEVLGYGQGVVNGNTITGIPYIGRFGAGNDPSTNINNYLARETWGGGYFPATVRRLRVKQEE